MKRFLLLATIVCAAILSSCDKYDDSKVWDTLNDHENRIQHLEELCAQMNTNISSLQTIVNALQQKDFITTVAPINKDGKEVGYSITFSSGKSITIYHGNDGKNGSDGEDGKDGKDGTDGHTPIIGVKQASDGVYYWTVDGEWLLDADGNKIKAQSADSENGEDGITPQLKIEADYWYVSYDNGQSWIKLGKATGEDGAEGSNGSSGDSFFQDVTEDDKCVYFTLADGTVLTVAKYVELQLFFDVSSLKDVKVNSEVKVDYTVTGSAQKVEIEVMPSNDLRAEAVADDATKKSGHILIRTGSSFDSASKVVVLVSDGDKVVMKSISLQVVEDDEAAQLYVYNGATKNIGAAGGAVTLSFLTNVDCEAVIPDDAKSWISVAGTRALENKHITLNVAQNTADRRSAKVKVQSLDGKLSVEYTISQAGTASSSTPDVDDDGTILGTPAGNEIFYTSTNGKVIEPSTPSAFGAAIVSNTYANGVGVIVFDRDITSIGRAFEETSLKSISLPNSIKSIPDRAFNQCYNLISIRMPNSILKIGNNAFRLCNELTIIIIPEGVSTIGYGAFSYCSKLSKIYIPTTLTQVVGESYIDASATFAGCSQLKEVYIQDLTSWCNIDFEDSEGNPLCQGANLYLNGNILTNVNIPSGIISIKKNLFYNCTSITEVTIPEGVNEIGYYAFGYCKNLSAIHLPNTLKEIGNVSFSNCTSLINLNIPNSVESIAGSAFYSCQSMTKIIIGNGVKSIGAGAFSNCLFLNEIICMPATPPTCSGTIFNNIGTSAKIYVPVGSGAAYKAANYWSNYASIIEEKAM